MGIINADKIPAAYSIAKISPRLIFETNNGSKLDTKVMKIEAIISSLSSQGMFRKHIILITHGFKNSIETEWLVEMKNEILKHYDALVCRVGWEGGAKLKSWKYSQAASNTQEVGKWLAPFLLAIRSEIPRAYIWGIGHSLGAHVMGRAGRGRGKFNRITGLDPAGPSFETAMVNQALCSSDADIVDIIHTDGFEPTNFNRIFSPKPKVGDEHNANAATDDQADYHIAKSESHDGRRRVFSDDLANLVNHYGTLKPCGTIDFYPNWGYLQPGSVWEDLTNIVGSLSHSRACKFFTWSIGNPGKMITNLALDGIPAVDKPVHKSIITDISVEMGFHYRKGKVKTGHSLYVLSTNNKVPWK